MNLHKNKVIGILIGFESIYFFISILVLIKGYGSINLNKNPYILKMPPKIDVLLFLSITMVFINVLVLLSSTRRKTNLNLKKGIIVLFIMNAAFVYSFSISSFYGYINNDTLNYKYAFSNFHMYKLRDIESAEISVIHKASVDNYYIEYEIYLKSGLSFKLSDYTGSYTELLQVNKVIEQNSIHIERDKLSIQEQQRILKWCKEYPEDLEPFKLLLNIK